MSLFSKSKKTIEQVSIEGIEYALNIFIEKRFNSRVSITRTGINIRIPKYLKESEKEKQIAKFKQWAIETITKKGIHFVKNQRIFKNNEKVLLYDKVVTLVIHEVDKKRVSGTIDSDNLKIEIPSFLEKEEKNKNITKIISKLLAKNYKEKISTKLHEFNQQFGFGEIQCIKLKNNKSNWGSCSSKNNINISIRLLLTPEWVVDYVLIHELCHLVHKNHSGNFWDLVEKCYPRYKEAEKWLKVNSSKCII